MNIKVFGLDLAKKVFQGCVWLEDGQVQWNRAIKRARLLDTVRQLPPGTLIAMEACCTSHYWGRTFLNMGYRVKLLPAQHVKAMARKQKNDANDALAICEAAFRPKFHAVGVKSIEQQDIKTLRSLRRELVRQRTALANQTRGIAAEYGVIFPKGIHQLQSLLLDALEDAGNELSTCCRSALHMQRKALQRLTDDIDTLTRQLEAQCKQHPRYRALLSIPGFGPIVAAAFLSEVGNGAQFSNGRQVSAWVGLVPSQFGSGGVTHLGSITKRGNRELRTLLIHGARTVCKYAEQRDDPMGYWLHRLIARRGKKKAIVALANKMARVGWRILQGSEPFEANQAFKAA